MVPEPGVEIEARIRESYGAKASAELAAADRLVPGASAIAGHGSVFAQVVLLKGDPGEEDRPAGRALAGADGEAADKVLVALGLDPGAVWRMCTRVAGPDVGAGAATGGPAAAEARARRVELAIEAVDPDLVIALDMDAGEDLARAFGAARLEPGKPVQARGRTLGAVSGLAASLGDESAKARVWAELRGVAGGRAD
jgi:hypothetical protein